MDIFVGSKVLEDLNGQKLVVTLLETNIFAPENWWLKDEHVLFGMAPLQVRTVSFRECMLCRPLSGVMKNYPFEGDPNN